MYLFWIYFPNLFFFQNQFQLIRIRCQFFFLSESARTNILFFQSFTFYCVVTVTTKKKPYVAETLKAYCEKSKQFLKK